MGVSSLISSVRQIEETYTRQRFQRIVTADIHEIDSFSGSQKSFFLMLKAAAITLLMVGGNDSAGRCSRILTTNVVVRAGSPFTPGSGNRPDHYNRNREVDNEARSRGIS